MRHGDNYPFYKEVFVEQIAMKTNNINKDFERALAKSLREIREKKGISQMVMRMDTGINIGRIECGEYSIELKTFIRICSYLDTSYRDILDIITEN